MTQSKKTTFDDIKNRQKVILENDPLYKEKAKWAKKFNHLIGLKIVGVRYLTKEETEANYWYSSPIVIELSDGSALIPQADDEGNDGGALWIANCNPSFSEVGDLIPVIRD